MKRPTFDDRGTHLLAKEVDKVGSFFEDRHYLRDGAEHDHARLQRCTALLDGGVCVPRAGDEDPPSLGSTMDSHEVLSHRIWAQSMLPPLHLDEVDLAVD